MNTDEVDYRDVELRMFQHMLADDMSEHPVTPEREQEIAALVAKPVSCSSSGSTTLGDSVAHASHQATKISLAFHELEKEREYQQRAHMYRLLKAGYTVKDNIFKEPAAEPVRPNPRNKKPEVLTQEQQRRLDRIKKTLKKRK